MSPSDRDIRNNFQPADRHKRSRYKPPPEQPWKPIGDLVPQSTMDPRNGLRDPIDRMLDSIEAMEKPDGILSERLPCGCWVFSTTCEKCRKSNFPIDNANELA